MRTGNHCAQPILRRFGLETTLPPSLPFNNTCAEVDRPVAVVRSLSGGGRSGLAWPSDAVCHMGGCRLSAVRPNKPFTAGGRAEVSGLDVSSRIYRTRTPGLNSRSSPSVLPRPFWRRFRSRNHDLRVEIVAFGDLAPNELHSFFGPIDHHGELLMQLLAVTEQATGL